MVMEAVWIKVSHQDAEAQKKAQEEAERKQFKSDRSSLDQFR